MVMTFEYAFEGKHLDLDVGQRVSVVVAGDRNPVPVERRGRTGGEGARAVAVPGLEGVVRFEAQERRRSLNGIELAALGEGTVERLGRRRFEWCGFDHRTSTLRGVIDRAMTLDDVGEGTRLQLVGYAALLDAGFGGRLERTRDYRLRRLLEDVGVPAPVDLVLDWDEGLIAA